VDQLKPTFPDKVGWTPLHNSNDISSVVSKKVQKDRRTVCSCVDFKSKPRVSQTTVLEGAAYDDKSQSCTLSYRYCKKKRMSAI
jgi:hypothetical protein